MSFGTPGGAESSQPSFGRRRAARLSRDDAVCGLYFIVEIHPRRGAAPDATFREQHGRAQPQIGTRERSPQSVRPQRETEPPAVGLAKRPSLSAMPRVVKWLSVSFPRSWLRRVLPQATPRAPGVAPVVRTLCEP